MKCRCIVCKGIKNHNILKEQKQHLTDEEGWWEESIFQIIQCAGCDKITFRELYTDVSVYDGEEYHYREDLYPKRNAHTRDIKSTKNLPKILTTIYRETIDTFNNEQYILCTAGLRALIEGICNDKEILGKEVITETGKKIFSTSLGSKIDGLSISKYLTEENCKALHELRFLGNEALHELTPPEVDDLILAIDIVELTLTNIYELGHKTRKLRISAEARKVE